MSAAVKRLSITIIAGICVEAINRLIPLFMIHFAQKKIGVEGFGFAQYGISLIELVIPLVVFGYNTWGTVQIGKIANQKREMSQLVSNVLSLKLIHALAVCTALLFAIHSAPSYRQYFNLMLALSFSIFFSGIEMLWVMVGIQKMAIVSLFTGFSKLLSLVLVILFVASPDDAIRYAVFTLIANASINACTFFFCLRRFPLVWPNLKHMKHIFKSSIAIAAIYFFSVVIERIDLFVIERYFDPISFGLYSGSLRITHSFFQIFSAIILAFFSEMIVLKDKESLSKHLHMGIWILLLIVAPVVSGIWFVDKELLELIFDNNFSVVRRVFSILILGSLGTIVLSAFGLQILMIKDRTWDMAKALIIGSITIGLGAIIVSELFLRLNFEWLTGLYGIAISALVGKFIAAFLIIKASRSFITRFPFAESMRAVVPAAIMVVSLLIFNRSGLVWNLGFGGFIFCLSAAAFNYSEIKQIYQKLFRTSQ